MPSLSSDYLFNNTTNTENDNRMMKAEKSSSFPASFCAVGGIKKLLRIAEIFILLAVLTWASTKLPFAVRISGEYLRWLVNIVVSHLFVFLLSNAIVLILFFKSRGLFLQHGFQDNREIFHVDFCRDIIAANGGGAAYFSGESFGRAEEIVYQDKETILEVTTKVRVHKRSQSENFRREMQSEIEEHDCTRQLRRSETEIRRRVEEEEAAEQVEMVEELSNEEFQRTIDAFIAKQIKFHQEEKLTIVLHECN